jgi:colanic acid biosynthesis glycosyl transferase WcaI
MRVLILNQAFYPDVASTAQHASDCALELMRRGHAVTVICSRRAYDDPDRHFPPTEVWNGIQIKRVWCLGFGKGSMLGRGLVFASYLVSCAIALLRLPSCDAVIAMTSPPLISFLGALFTRLKGGRLVFWVMDLNPDEAIAAGWLRENSLTARALRSVLHFSLRRSTEVIVLDRFMRKRIEEKGVPGASIAVIPPWPHETAVQYTYEGRNRFRAAHGIENKFVVMYSGNHSPCHPLNTLLRAAAALSARNDIVFCFVGGGSEFRKVQHFAADRRLTNILCLPYQPIEKLSDSLSAADLHVVVLGNPFVGVVHPCKVYNILTLGVPLLYIGPAVSHITDLLPAEAIGNWAYLARHEQPDLVAAQILAACNKKMVPTGALASQFSQDKLLSRFCEVIESGRAKTVHKISGGSGGEISEAVRL